MNKIILILLLIIGISTSFLGQSTFSKEYNLDVGWSNHPGQFVQLADEFIVALSHICFEDTLPCTSILKLNYQGYILKSHTEDNFNFGNYDAMLWNQDTLICSGHNKSSGFKYIDILDGDFLKSEYDKNQYLENDGYHYWNNGILRHQGHIYTYGDTKKEGTGRTGIGYASIVKWDSTASKVLAVWRYRYRDGFENHCYQLQAMPDGNLVFRNDVRRAESPKSLDVITIIDTLGNIVKNIEFKDLGNWSKPKLILDRSGNYYLNANFDPRLLFHDSRGGILKLNANHIDVDWHMIFPFDVFTNERQYFVSDFYEASNGDILTCGSIGYQDRNDPSNGGTSGFIARVSPQGVLLWLRMYRIPNPLYPDTRGYYKPSYLKQIEETPSGHILCIGGANQREISGSFSQELWILTTDQNGCVEGYDCDSVVILSEKQEEVYHPFVDTTLRWHERQTDYHAGKTKTKKYKLDKDSTLIGPYFYHNVLFTFDKTNEQWDVSESYLRENDKKVWLNRKGKEYLLYDFDLNVSDTFESELLESNGKLVVTNIDSVLLDDGSIRRRTTLQCVGPSGNCFPLFWIEGIGAECNTFNLRDACVDVIAESTKLLCFYQNNELLWYDTTQTSCFISTSTKEVDELKGFIQLYPNPVYDILHIRSEELIKEMVILDQFSHIIQQCSDCREIDLSGIYPGVYYLKVKLSNDQVIYKKFVKVFK